MAKDEKGQMSQPLKSLSTRNVVGIHIEHVRKAALLSMRWHEWLVLVFQQRARTRICMSVRQHAATSRLFCSDRRSWHSGLLLFDQSV